MSDNTASNLGTGQGIFGQKVGDDLQFKSLLAGTNITLTADANNITITASNDTTALNLGIGSGLFTSKSGDDLQFRSIIANADSGISVTQNSNDLTFQLVSANVDAGKLGGVAASDFLRKSDNLASLASASTARTNLSVYSKAEIDANVMRNNTNVLPSTDSTWSLGSNSYKWANIYADRFYGRASVAGAIDSIANIGDVDVSGAVNGSVLKYNSSNGNWEVGSDNNSGGVGGSATFLGLTDTPSNFTGDAGKVLRVNSGETAIEFTSDIATTSYVDTAVANLVASAPAALDTLNELAAALGNDANFSTTVTNSIATKLASADLNSGIDAHLNQSNPTSGYVLSWNGSDYAWVVNGSGSGDITRVNITAGTGLTGTQDTTSGDHTQTLAVDVGTGANQIVQLDGSGRLPAVDGSQLTGVSTTTTLAGLTDTTIGTPASGEVLYHNGSAWVDQALTTNIVTEGSNLYYTDTRVDTRIASTPINSLSDVDVSGATNGQVLKYNASLTQWEPQDDAGMLTVALTDISDVTITLPTSGQVLKYNGAAWVNDTDAGGIALTDLSVTTGSASGSGSLSYDNSTGVFSFAPADLSSYLTDLTGSTLTSLSDVDAVAGAGDDGKVLYYDHATTSFKWKTDATGSSYSDADVDAHLNQSNPTSGYVLSWNGSDYAWVANGTGGITDIVNDTSPQLGGTLDANGNTIDMGTNVITDAKVGQWDTAYGWGDHSTAGYLTSYTETNDLSSAVTWANVPDVNITQSSVTQHQAALSITESQISDLGTYQTVAGLNAAVDSHLNQSNPTAGYVLSWNGSDYAWIDNTGYTSFNTDFDTRLATKDTDNVAEGLTNLYYTDTRADARITAAGSANWNTAYGWGDHSTQGYLTTISGQGLTTLSDVDAVAAGDDGKVLYYDHATTSFKWKGDAGTLSTAGNIGTGSIDLATDTLQVTGQTNQINVSAAAFALSLSLDSDITGLSTINTHTIPGGTGTFALTSQLYSNSDVDAHLNQSNPTAGYVLSWNGSDYAWIDNTGYTSFNTDFDTRLATKSTTDLAEGSNLYYTDTRVDSRITANWLIDEDNMSSDSATKIPSQQSVKAYVDSQVATANELGEMTDVTLTSVANNQFLKYNSSTSQWENATVTASTAAGSDTYVQFNDGGVMGGDAGFVYNKTTDALTVGSVTTTGAAPSVSAAGNLTIETTASNGNIALTPNGTGDITLGANVTIDGSDNGYLKWTAPYATTGDLPNATTYHGMFAHVHATGKGYFAHNGSWVELANHSQLANSSNWDTAYGWGDHGAVGYLTAETSHADVLVDGDFSSAGIMATDGSGTYSIVTDNSSNWNTAFGWGDHASAGYQSAASLNSDIDSHLNQSNPTSGYVLSWNGSDYAWVAQSGGSTTLNGLTDVTITSATNGQVLKYNGSAWVNDTDAGGIALTDISVGTEASASGDGGIAYNNSTGVFTYTPPTAAGIGALADITSENLADLADVNSTAPTDGQVLTWDNANSYWKPATVSGGSGSAGTEYEEFKLNYATDGTLASTSNLSSGISGVTIDSASGGDVTITFTGYTTPPLSVIFYGYNYAANEYNVNTLGSTGTTLRKVPGGGSSGSPTAFGSFSTISFKIREAETGASRSFGTTTHAWIRFVMGA